MALVNDTNPTPKKDPNFLVVVILAAIAIVIILVFAFFTIDWEGKRLVPRAHDQHSHSTSSLRLASLPAKG